MKPSVQKAPLDLSLVIEEDEAETDEKEMTLFFSQESSAAPAPSAHLTFTSVTSLQVTRDADSEPSSNPAEQERVAQALIDSRCYDLTVLPLADVSTAYCQSHPGTLDDDVQDAREVMTPLDDEMVLSQPVDVVLLTSLFVSGLVVVVYLINRSRNR